jgi:uncharacterized protein (TIGR04222 family)
MNPFALSGPNFLMFYVVFATVVLVTLVVVRLILESGRLPRLETKDPYLLACLRGGPAEVIRVAQMALIDRGLLRLTGTNAIAAGEARTGLTRVERGVLEYYQTSGAVSAAAKQTNLLNAARGDYEDRLRREALVPDDARRSTRLALLGTAVFALVGVGGAKLVMAVQQGRQNIWFLVILMVGTTIAALVIHNPYRTTLGEKYLAGVRSLFEDLQRRAPRLRPGSGSREVMWLTALFGAGALSSAFSFAELFRPAKASGSSCGSSCGSSSSGCGGGGGGCGGCGGA